MQCYGAAKDFKLRCCIVASAQLGFSVVIQKIKNAHLKEIFPRWLAGDSLLGNHALFLFLCDVAPIAQ